MRNRKGFALLTVLVATLIIIAGISASLFFLMAHIQSLRYYDERLKGYYLCEAGASRALYLIKSGGAVPQRGSFDFRMGDRQYKVSYEVTGTTNSPLVIATIKLDSGLTYYLKIGGSKEQWPFFLKGLMPPLAD